MMIDKPIRYEIQRVITNFIIDRPGVEPKYILLESKDINRTLNWIKSNPDIRATRTGVGDNGELFVYGLRALGAPDDSGIAVAGFSGPTMMKDPS